jgi:hypothetical protein
MAPKRVRKLGDVPEGTTLYKIEGFVHAPGDTGTWFKGEGPQYAYIKSSEIDAWNAWKKENPTTTLGKRTYTTTFPKIPMHTQTTNTNSDLIPASLSYHQYNYNHGIYTVKADITTADGGKDVVDKINGDDGKAGKAVKYENISKAIPKMIGIADSHMVSDMVTWSELNYCFDPQHPSTAKCSFSTS